MTSVPDPITTISSTIKFTKSLSYNEAYWGHCFAWCSLLPKDYEFQKDHLFHLWKAHKSFTYRYESLEEQLDLFFNEFLRKGYFLEGDTIGSIIMYKINHLVFELMKYVAGDDFCLVDKTTPEPNHKIIRHASFIVDPSWEPPSWPLKAKQLQSLLLWPHNSGEFITLSKIDILLSGMTHLRALHAEAIHCERLPEFLVKFEKLEYLRFGAVSSISIPDDAYALHKLLDCDFRYNSTNKRVLHGGYELFDDDLEQQQKHVLHVKFAGIEYQKSYDPNSSKQTNKKTGSLKFKLTSFNRDDGKLTSLNPPRVLERQNICHWKGENLPAWPVDTLSFFPSSLISIQIGNFSGCQHLPGFNTLPHLTSLQLGGLCSLVDITVSWEDSETSSKKTFYPSLKCLVLCDLPELKGWSIAEEDNNQHIEERYCFPLLTKVRVQGCPNLFSMPSVPMLESLEAINIHAKTLNHLLCPPLIMPLLSENTCDLKKTSKEGLPLMTNLEIDGCKEFEWGDRTNVVDKRVWHDLRCLRSLKLVNSPELMSLPGDLKCITMIEKLSLCWLANLKVLPEWIGQFTHLRQFTILYCPKLTRLPKSDGSFSALEQLQISCCPRVSQFPESLPNLKRLVVEEFGRLEQILCMSQNLEELEINNCDELEWETPSVEGDVSVNVWESCNSLHSLKLAKMDQFPKGLDFAKMSKLSRLVIERCPKLTNLPESLCSLCTLEHLWIHYCPRLINIPDDFLKLVSLKKLEIRGSPQLEKRCKRYGNDWSLIQHIPDIVIDNSQQRARFSKNGAEQQGVA